MAKWLGSSLARGGSAATRAKDTDRQDACQILDSALSDGQLSMEEHLQRVATATQAVTLGDLQHLVADLQSESAPAEVPALKSRGQRNSLGLLAAALGVSILLGVAIGWGLYGNTRSPLDFTTDPGAKPDGVAAVVLTPPKQLHSLGGLTGLLEQTRKRFGDTMGYRMVIYPEYAVLDRKDPADERRILSYTYRGGWGGSHRQRPKRRRHRTRRPGQVRREDGSGHHARGRGDPGDEAERRHQHVPVHQPRERPDHPRGDIATVIRLERLRQWIHRLCRRRHHQTGELPVLARTGSSFSGFSPPTNCD
ncbi:membrane protein [Mycobacterium ulcerans subsp. shinshuense]|uniref:Membrane protein n=1 Tax=Mycobacterium ulcerans subsp. shinshuense TaxID=1124626 RepID=A0A1B4XXF4_MYCUL|nr:membrane protein [Mycobacterium ulcerans subsp. shinshuense]